MVFACCWDNGLRTLCVKVARYPTTAAVISCDQLHPELAGDANARANFAPNGGSGLWRKFVERATNGTPLHARLTYTQLNAYANQFANGLCQLGIQNGDRVGVWLPNTWQYAAAQVAISIDLLMFYVFILYL